MLLGHIVNKGGISIGPTKVVAIMEALGPKNAKELGRLLGKVHWHIQVLRYLADVGTPLHTIFHKEKFEWIEECEKAFRNLKVLL